MKCPEPAIVEAIARGELESWPPGVERHLDTCAQCMDRLVEASAFGPTAADVVDLPADDERELPEMPEDRYEFVGELGRGGQSRVFRAYDRLLRHEVAFKQFVPRSSSTGADATARARFLREVGIMADLGHPGVIPILDLGVRDGWPYCTMQIVRGQTLATARAQAGDGPQSLDRLLTHFVSICDTVGFAHRLGIVHRDLKPDNIMTGAFGQTYLLDWALAKRLDGADASSSIAEGGPPPLDPATTELGAAVGTPAYMSPEHLDARVGADPSSDIWSLGAVLFFIVTGRPPFEAQTMDELLERVRDAHRGGLPQGLLSGVPRDLAEVIRHAMSPSRRRRYEDAGAIGRDVEAFRTDQPVSVVRYPWWERLARAARHHPALVFAAAAVTVAISAGLLVSWGALRRESAAHGQTASALVEATQARDESERSFQRERRRAAEVTAALVDSHARRADAYRSEKRPLSARAEAALALRAATALDETLLEGPARASLNRAMARVRGEFLAAEIDSVVGYRGTRPYAADRIRSVSRGGGLYSTWDHSGAMTVRHSADGRAVAARATDAFDISAIALSPSAQTAAMVTRDDEGRSTVTSWSVSGGTEHQWTVPVKDDGILAVSDDGIVAANTASDGVIVLWQGRASPVEVGEVPNWSLALSRDGEALGISGNGGELLVVDPATGAPVMHCGTHSDRLTAITVGPGHRHVVAGCVSGHAVVCSDTGLLTVPAHRSRVTAVEISSDGRLAFTASMDGRLAVIDLQIGRVVASIDTPRQTIYNLAYDVESESIFAFAADGVYRWQLAPGRLFPVRAVGHEVQRAFDFDGQTFVLPHGIEPLVVEVDVATGRARALSLGDAGPPAAAYGRGKDLFTVDFAGMVSRFERGPQELRFIDSFSGEGQNLNATAFYGDLAALEHKSPYGVTLWDLDDGRRVASLEGHARSVFTIAFSSDGDRLASADAGGKLVVWDVPSHEQIAVLREAGAPILGLDFDAQGGIVAASDDGLVWWDDVAATQPHVLDDAYGYRHVAVDARHHRVAASRAEDNHLAVWSLDDGGLSWEFMAAIGVADLAFAPDGETLYWLSSRRMQALTLPETDRTTDLERLVDAALTDARLERVVLLRSGR